MNRNYLLLFSVSVLFALEANSQKIRPNTEIDTYFSEARAGKTYYLSAEVVKEADAGKVLKTSSAFLDDKDARVRYRAIDLIKRKALYLTSPTDRAPFVVLLVRACKDPDGGNVDVASRGLTFFNKADFNPQAQDSIVSLLALRPFHYDRIIRVAGFLQNKKAEDYLRQTLLNDSTLSKKLNWTVRLALARMDDPSSTAYCLEKVKSAPVDDNVVTYLFPDLVYTRQQVAVEYMLNEILSDSKNCNSPNPDSDAKIICAYKIIELVGPVIAEFPLPSSGGEVEIDDYDKDLEVVRDWIGKKPQIVISTEMF